MSQPSSQKTRRWLPRLLRRCRCFHRPLGAGVMVRVPLKVCPKHGHHECAYDDLQDYLSWEAQR